MGAKLGEAQAALAGISRAAMIIAELSASRTVWMEVLRHLIVAGNTLVYHPEDGTRMRMWRLDQYVVQRNAQGDLMTAVVKGGDLSFRAGRSHKVRRRYRAEG